MLNDQIFARGMDRFQRRWAKTFTEGQLLEFYEPLKYLADDIFRSAVDACVREARFFPTPAEILTQADKAQSELRKQQIQAENKSSRRFLCGPTRHEVTPFVKECHQLMKDRFEGNLDSFGLAEKLFELDKKYPGKHAKESALKIYNREAKKKNLSPLRPQEVA